jgi:hypothetical protein
MKDIPLTDDLPIPVWQRVRTFQADHGTDQITGPPDDRMSPAAWQRARRVQVSHLASPPAPRSARQWETESAQAMAKPSPQPAIPVNRQGNSVADWAVDRVGGGEYHRWTDNAPDAQGPLDSRLPRWARGYGDPKCNQFVWDALVASGVTPGRMERSAGRGGRIPLARDWGNSMSKIDGYAPVTGQARPGDVVSDGHHAGIYATLPDGRPGTVSAASPFSGEVGLNGGVVHNDWGFRRRGPPVTIWRSVGGR